MTTLATICLIGIWLSSVMAAYHRGRATAFGEMKELLDCLFSKGTDQ